MRLQFQSAALSLVELEQDAKSTFLCNSEEDVQVTSLGLTARG
jgi:hypothetical protein